MASVSKSNSKAEPLSAFSEYVAIPEFFASTGVLFHDFNPERKQPPIHDGRYTEENEVWRSIAENALDLNRKVPRSPVTKSDRLFVTRFSQGFISEGIAALEESDASGFTISGIRPQH